MPLLKRLLVLAAFAFATLVSTTASAGLLGATSGGVAIGTGTGTSFPQQNLGLSAPPVADSITLYADPYYVTLVSGNVVSALDRSGGGNPLQQTTVAIRPPWSSSSIGNRPAFAFNGSSYLDAAGFQPSEPLTILIVTQGTFSSFTSIVEATACVNGRMALRMNAGTPTPAEWFPTLNGGGLLTGPLDFTASSSVLSIVSAGTATSYLAGVSWTTGVCATPFMWSAAFRFGAACTGAFFWNGPLSVVIVWSRALTAPEIAAVAAWSVSIWGV